MRPTLSPKPKRSRKKLQTPNPEVRQRLLDAAADLIREGGYAALRIEDIAERAALSVGTFYLYFESKPDVFMNLIIDYTERLRTRVREARQGDGPVAVRLSYGLDAYIDFVLETEPGFIPFARESGTMLTNAGPLSSWAFKAHAEDLEPFIREAMDRGEMRPADPVLVSQALVGLTQHLVLYWLEHKDQYTRAELKSFVDMFGAFGLAPFEARRGR
jgi:AcrR family transcriptional regulator